MLQRKLAALLMFYIVLLAAGCSMLSHEAPNDDIDKAAALFFQRFGNEEYDKIYDDAAKSFKDSQTRQTVIDSLKQMAEKGKILDHFRISMTLQGEGKSRMAHPVYTTATDRVKAEITLTFQDERGEWKLFGFAYKPRS
jgi:hypothetical protein